MAPTAPSARARSMSRSAQYPTTRGPDSSAARRSRPVKSSSEEMSGPPHSCTEPIPREAACRRAARWASVRCCGVTAEWAAARTAWWASRVSGPSGVNPGRSAMPGTRSSRAVVTAAEWTSMRER